MKTLQVTSQEFAQQQDALLDLATQGTRVFINRNNEHFFMLTPINAEYADNEQEYEFSPAEIAHIKLAQQQAQQGDVTVCNTIKDSLELLESL